LDAGVTTENILIFDIDGTLMLSGPITRQHIAGAFEHVYGVPAQLDGMHFAGMTDRGIFAELADRSNLNPTEQDFVKFGELFAASLGEHYPTADGPHLMPGVRELLERLASTPSTVMVLGSGNLEKTAFIKLRRFGLDGFFVGGAFGDKYLDRSDIFAAALELGKSHVNGDHRAWVIGDTLEDIRAARVVGVPILAVGTGPGWGDQLEAAGPDAFVADFSDTDHVVKILEGSS